MVLREGCVVEGELFLHRHLVGRKAYTDTVFAGTSMLNSEHEAACPRFLVQPGAENPAPPAPVLL